MKDSTVPNHPKSKRVIFLLPLFVLLALFAVFLWGLNDSGSSKIWSALINKPAPSFELGAVKGLQTAGFATRDLLDSGKVTVVNVFASWCVPCLAEHPFLAELGGRDDIRLYGINFRDEEAVGWLAKHGNPYDRIGADSTGRVSIDWGVTGVPESFILDQDGIIRYKHVGPINPGELERKIIPVIESLQREGR